MATQFPELFEELMEEFHPDQVRHRPDGGYQYVTVRTIMNRLDKVLGPENWWDSYRETPTGVICELTIRLPSIGDHCLSYAVTKSGYGCNPPITAFQAGERSDNFKDMAQYKMDAEAAYADAFKRAAVKFGVSRYMYNEGLPALTRGNENASENAVHVTQSVTSPNPPSPTVSQANGTDSKDFVKNPAAGTSDVWTWIINVAKHYRLDCPKLIAELSQKHGLSTNYADWDAATVDRICKYLRKHAIKSSVYKGEFDGQSPPDPPAPTAAVAPAVDPMVKKAQDDVWKWGQWLANQRAAAGEAVTEPTIRGLIYTASGGKWNHPGNCQDINFLDSVVLTLKNSSTTY